MTSSFPAESGGSSAERFGAPFAGCGLRRRAALASGSDPASALASLDLLWSATRGLSSFWGPSSRFRRRRPRLPRPSSLDSPLAWLLRVRRFGVSALRGAGLVSLGMGGGTSERREAEAQVPADDICDVNHQDLKEMIKFVKEEE